jgi:protocatechuate 3,4-dioxygenase beta subunit
MKRLLLLVVLSVAALSTRALPQGQSQSVREITARVLDEEDHLVADAEVILMGLGRGPMTSHREIFAEPGDANGQKAKGWKFVTNAKGECRVSFGKFDFWEHLKATGVAEPGYGPYFLVATKEGYAGGVSAKLLNYNDEDRKKFVPFEFGASAPEEDEEWEYDPRVLSDDPKDLERIDIVLKRGMEVSGQLLDEKGRPIPGEQINLWNNLGADTHTGRGGEIFERTDETDHAGRFHFHRVYPNLFHLGLLSQQDDSLCWLRTRVRKRWVDGIHDVIWPHQGDTNIPVVIVATRERPFHYFGKVTDEKGRPIAGATVRIQAGIHGPGQLGDFDDGHSHFSQAVTRTNGTYDVAAAGPYVNWFRITAAGFKGDEYMEDGEIYGFNRYEEVPCAPGRYDFTLKRK